MKLLIEYLPIALFAAAYYLRDIYFATVVLIVALVVQTAALWVITRKPPKMQLAITALAIVFGGLTLAVHDPLFIQAKPSVIYLAFALVLAGSHFIGDKVLLARMLGGQIQLPNTVWQRLSIAWIVFFLFQAVLNLYIAWNFSETFWVNYKLFGTLGMTLVFILLQAVYMSRHMQEQAENEQA